MPSTRNVIGWAVGGAVLVLLAALAFVWFGPVTIGDKKMMLDFMLGRGIQPPPAAEIERRLQVAPGFTLTVYSADVPLARWPLATTGGDLLVSRTRAGAIALLERDHDGDGKPEAVRTLLEGLDHPHGLALHDGWLYVAQGSSCNACVERDERRTMIMRMRPDGSERGGFYGWPYVHGDGIPDPDLGTTIPAQLDAGRFIGPAHTIRAHNAPLGLSFLRGDVLPPAYERTASSTWPTIMPA